MSGLAVLWIACLSPGAIGGDQFVRLIRAVAEPLQDIAFLYEGEEGYIDPSLAADPFAKSLRKTFQGTFLYRRKDHAAWIDVYVRADEPSEEGIVRIRESHLRNEIERLSLPADLKRDAVNRHLRRSQGSLYQLISNRNPLDFFYLWRFDAVEDPLAWGYEDLGDESVEGHRCRKIKLKFGPVGPGPGDYNLYWIDFERGGHPLRIDEYFKDRMLRRTDGILLDRMETADGAACWFPVKARIRKFKHLSGGRLEPTYEKVYEVITSTIRLNQGLPDEVFSVSKALKLPVAKVLPGRGGKTDALTLRREYEAAPASSRSRTDPASIRERLDQALVKANRQAEELDASPPGGFRAWGWGASAQAGAAALGLILLISAFFLRRGAR